MLEMLPGGIAKLSIGCLNSDAAQVDAIFEQIRKENPPTLIIDLNFSYGGNPSVMRVVSNLVDTVVDRGAVVTGQWFKRNFRPPSEAQCEFFPMLADSTANLLSSGIHEYDGICLKLMPVRQPYRGKVFVLTSGSTRGTVEPLAHIIKQCGLCTPYGN